MEQGLVDTGCPEALAALLERVALQDHERGLDHGRSVPACIGQKQRRLGQLFAMFLPVADSRLYLSC